MDTSAKEWAEKRAKRKAVARAKKGAKTRAAKAKEQRRDIREKQREMATEERRKTLRPRVRIVRTFSVEHDDAGNVLSVRDEENIFVTREQLASLIIGLRLFCDDISDSEIDRIRAWDIVQRESSKRKPKPLEGPGFIYLMKLDKYYKIGISKNPDERLGQLQCSFPLPITLVHKIEVMNMRRTETHLHDHFAPCWATGEWFRLSANDIQWIIENEGRLSEM